ncbi:uncharacterized protein LOC111346205 [Stylophora pistillata]|uniref:uncharacterized protein LOC111346205 n=1 Tax=Stylophora pistillata TaxID=50429 RepID=UPI000C044B70|nr:uncharacterized protein LOC111346205 [Stylophora pistillata]
MNRKKLNSYRRNGTWLSFTCCIPQFTDSFFEDSVNKNVLSVMSDDDSIPDSLEWFSGNISSYYNSNIKIAHLNINSIQNKLDEIKEMLNRNMFDILFIGETKLDGSYSSSLLYHPGYRIVRRDRKKGAGGLMAFIREDLSAYRRQKLEPESVEEICLDVTDFRKCRLIVCACYRSENVNKPAEFISSLSSAIELMFRCRQEIILIGDYNLDMLVNEDEGRRKNKALRDLCDRFCLFKQITEPTRITEKSQSLIDVILASHPERFATNGNLHLGVSYHDLVFATSGNLHLGVSDHDLVFAVRKQKTPRPTAREIEYRNVDDLWDHWAKLYCKVLDRHAPLKKKWIRGDQLPWITPELQREISRRSRLFKKYARNPTDSSWEEYRKQRNKVTLLKRKGVKSFCVDASLNKKHHGEFWRKVKPRLPSKGKTQSKIVLQENEQLITDPRFVAEIFNDYSCDATTSDGAQMSVDELTDHPSVKRIPEHFGHASNFDFQLIEAEYLKDILLKLSPRKAVGCDNISQRLLRITAPAVAQPLKCLINYFITSCSWPMVWNV